MECVFENLTLSLLDFVSAKIPLLRRHWMYDSVNGGKHRKAVCYFYVSAGALDYDIMNNFPLG